MEQITTQDIEMLGSDSQLVFGGTFEGGIHLQQVPDEISPCLNDILKSGNNIKNFLEIGSAAGGSSYLFDHVFDLDNIIIIDDNNHSKSKFRPEILKKTKGEVSEFIGDSKHPDAIGFIKKLKLKFDIILIDGDHTYDGVMSDIKNYSKFLSGNGFLILHDIEICQGVKVAFDELKKTGTWVSKKFISEKRLPCGLGLLQKRSK